MEDAAGWPFLAMKCNYAKEKDGRIFRSSVALGGLRLNTIEVYSNVERALPLSIIPLGFTANVIVFAIAWCLVLWLSVLRRKAVNRCPGCSYDLRERRALGCPECGWNRALPQQK